MRCGQSCEALEGRRSEVDGNNGPAALGEPGGVLARAAGEIQGAGMRMRARQERETFEQKSGGSRGRLRGGFAVTRLPAGERAITRRRAGHEDRLNAEGRLSQSGEGVVSGKKEKSGYRRDAELTELPREKEEREVSEVRPLGMS